MTFKIVVLSLMLGIWGLDAWSQNEEPDFSGQSEDSLMQALGNIPAFTIYKDNYVVTGTSFTGGKISKYNSDAKFQISLRHRLYRKLLPYRIYLFLTYSQKSFWDIYRKSAPFADNNYNPSLGFGRNFIGEGRIKGIGMVQFEHESNGRDSIWSRSWNRLTFTGIYLMNKNYTFQAKVWIAMQVAKENRHLTRYAGIGHLAATYASDNGRLSCSALMIKRVGWHRALPPVADDKDPEWCLARAPRQSATSHNQKWRQFLPYRQSLSLTTDQFALRPCVNVL